MRFERIAAILAAVLLSMSAYGGEDDNENKCQKTRKMAAAALYDLYKLEPSSQAAMDEAVGTRRLFDRAPSPRFQS